MFCLDKNIFYDERDYNIAAHMLMSMDIRSVALMTNDPRKVDGLGRHGISVTERIPHMIEPKDENRAYLLTKMTKSNHMIENLFDIHAP